MSDRDRPRIEVEGSDPMSYFKREAYFWGRVFILGGCVFTVASYWDEIVSVAQNTMVEIPIPAFFVVGIALLAAPKIAEEVEARLR